MPSFFVSMPAVVLLLIGIFVITDGAYVLGGVLIAIAVVLFALWGRMLANRSS